MALDNRSRFVAWAKIVLPLVALGILSTLFLLSHTLDPSDAIRFGEFDVEELVQGQRVGGPRFAGTTRDGSALNLAAATARPDPAEPRRILVSDVTASLEMPQNGRLTMRGEAAIVDIPAGYVQIDGDVVLETSTGYRVESQRLRASLEETDVRSETEVRATGPVGTLTAGGLELTENTGGYVLVFKDGVNLIYDPKD